MKLISGGVCAAKGFSASGIHCGIRKNHTKKDLALIACAVPASAAAVYTTNLVKGAPLTVTKAHLSDGQARAVIVNSGNANTCNFDGAEIAEKMCALAADALDIKAKDVIVASTGVIGQRLDVTPIAAALPGMAAALTTLPVIGIPIRSKALNGLDSLLSIVQMPSGIPVATMAIDGAKNAALYAVSMLALQDAALAEKLEAFRKQQADKVLQTEL